MPPLELPPDLEDDRPPTLRNWYDDQFRYLAKRVLDAELDADSLQNKLTEFEGKIVTGSLVKREDIMSCPEVSAIIVENERLKLLLQKRRKPEQKKKETVRKITFAEIVGNTTTTVPISDARPVVYDRRHDSRIIHIPHTATERSSVNVTATRIKFKIINVGQLEAHSIQQLLLKDRANASIKVENVYQVHAPNGKYNNAMLTCSVDRAAAFESYPYVYLHEQRFRVFESLNVPQCSNCWSYDHTRKNCNSERKCKSCSSSACRDQRSCVSFCWLCAGSVDSNHKNGSHVCAALIMATNNFKTMVFQGEFRNQLKRATKVSARMN